MKGCFEAMAGLVIERCSPTPVLVDGYGGHGEGVIIAHLLVLSNDI